MAHRNRPELINYTLFSFQVLKHMQVLGGALFQYCFIFFSNFCSRNVLTTHRSVSMENYLRGTFKFLLLPLCPFIFQTKFPSSFISLRVKSKF